MSFSQKSQGHGTAAMGTTERTAASLQPLPAPFGDAPSTDRQNVARVTGLEPATSGVTGRRSNRLSYTRIRVGQRLGPGGEIVKPKQPPRAKN